MFIFGLNNRLFEKEEGAFYIAKEIVQDYSSDTPVWHCAAASYSIRSATMSHFFGFYIDPDTSCLSSYGDADVPQEWILRLFELYNEFEGNK